MLQVASGWSVVLLLAGALEAASAAQNDAGTAHGVFTGEIKPVIYVQDVEKSAPFYRDVLGFEFQGYANREGQPYYAEMLAAGIKFGLHEPTSPGQETKVGQQRLYFRVEDVQAHRSRVLARGGEPGEIRTTDWMDLFIVRDHDGNEIVFAVTDTGRHPINPWNNKGGPDLMSLAWLSGRWIRESEGRRSTEFWLPPTENLMLGMNTTVSEGRSHSFEFLRIRIQNGNVQYVAMPEGQAETVFELVSHEGQRVVFENPEHDFPQRIIYWLEGENRLHARIEGEENGEVKGVEWFWDRRQ